jgi:hypothetical protein
MVFLVDADHGRISCLCVSAQEGHQDVVNAMLTVGARTFKNSVGSEACVECVAGKFLEAAGAVTADTCIDCAACTCTRGSHQAVPA